MTAPYGLLGFDQPSAITSLLQQMSGLPPDQPQDQGPPPAPVQQAAPIAPPAAAQQPHMLHRIAGLLGSLGSGIGSNVAGTVKGIGDVQAPEAYGGLLSPQEIQQAKPGRLHNIITALQGNDPNDTYKANLDTILKLHGDVAQAAEQRRLDVVRANMPDNLPPDQMFAYAMKNRDYGTAKLLEQPTVEAMKSSGTLAKVLAPGEVLIDKNGKVLYTAPAAANGPKPSDYMQYIDKKGDIHSIPKDQSPPPGEGWKPIALAQTQITVQGALDRVAAAAANKQGAATKALAAPMAAKVGQFGEMLKKIDDVFPAMEAYEMKLGSSAAHDVATGVGALGHIPGASAVGSMLLSRSPEAASYQAALTPFVLAAAHALSGARINSEQTKQIRASIELTPGMSPQERAQKKKNLIDLANSIGGSLPSDAVAEQEAQMGDAGIQRIRGYGYSPRTAAGPATPAAPKSPNGPPSYEDWLKSRKP